MPNTIIQSYRQGFQVLNNNLYLFWVNLAYILPFNYILPTTHTNSWLFILVPFITLTLVLANTKLLFDQPQQSVKIVETAVRILYKYLLRIILLCFGGTALVLTIYTLYGGNIETLLSFAQATTNPQATLVQKLILVSPLIILDPIIPFFKIFWVVKRQSFVKSIISGGIYAYKHISFTLIPSVVTILGIIIQHPIARYLNKPNPVLFTVLNLYLGLVMTSASIAYFKSHKVEG